MSNFCKIYDVTENHKTCVFMEPVVRTNLDKFASNRIVVETVAPVFASKEYLRDVEADTFTLIQRVSSDAGLTINRSYMQRSGDNFDYVVEFEPTGIEPKNKKGRNRKAPIYWNRFSKLTQVNGRVHIHHA